MEKKKGEDLELKIYKALGVKHFRNLAFKLEKLIHIKDKKKNINYHINDCKDLVSIDKFKKYLYYNGFIHVKNLIFGSVGLALMIILNASVVPVIALSTLLLKDAYCVMLQRYNCIRINQLIEKMTPRYEKQKDVIKEELIEKDSLLLEHSYKIVDKKEKEIKINFEDLIANASIEELKQYRNYLAYLQIVNRAIQVNDLCPDKEEIDMSMPIEKDKTLKFEFKNQNSIINNSDR